MDEKIPRILSKFVIIIQCLPLRHGPLLHSRSLTFTPLHDEEDPRHSLVLVAVPSPHDSWQVLHFDQSLHAANER